MILAEARNGPDPNGSPRWKKTPLGVAGGGGQLTRARLLTRLSPGPLDSACLHLGQATGPETVRLRQGHRPGPATHRDARVLLALVGGGHHGQVLDDFLRVLRFPGSRLASERHGNRDPQ